MLPIILPELATIKKAALFGRQNDVI